MYEALHLARDPELGVPKRMQVAQAALDYIRKRVTDANGFKTIDELLKAMKKDPSLQEKIFKSKEDGLGRVITEFNTLVHSIELEDRLSACKGAPRGLTQEVVQGMADYSRCSEGTWCNSTIITQTKQDAKTPGTTHCTPSYAYSKNISDIVNAGNALMLFQDDPDYGKDIFNPTPEQVKKQNRNFKTQEEAGRAVVTARLRGKVYERAIQSALRNRFTLMMKYQSPTPKAEEALGEVLKDCKKCTNEMRDSMRNHIVHLWNQDQSEGRGQIRPKSSVVSALCTQLKNSNYSFADFEDTEIGKSFKRDRDMNAEVRGTHGNAVQRYDHAKAEFDAKRRQVLTNLSQGGGDGLFVLTKALTQLDEQVPGKTKLGCTDQSRAQDEALVGNAFTEARDKTIEYTKKVNEVVHETDYSKSAIDSDLKALTELAPKQVGEALLGMGQKQLGNYACSILESIANQRANQKSLDDLVLWGGMVTGTLLVLATDGMAAPFVYSGLAAGAAINAGTAVYEWDRSGEAKALSETYRTAMIGQGGNDFLLKMTHEQFMEYKEHRLNAILSGAATGADVTLMVVKAAKAGKGIAEINQELTELEKSTAQPSVQPSVRASSSVAPVKFEDQAFREAYESGNFSGSTRYISYVDSRGKTVFAKVRTERPFLETRDPATSEMRREIFLVDSQDGLIDPRKVKNIKVSKESEAFFANLEKRADKIGDSPVFRKSDSDGSLTLVSKGKPTSPVTVVEMMDRAYTPVQQSKLNGAILGHGSNSSSLLAFTEYGGKSGELIPLGQLEARGRVPYSGEIVFGRSGVNQENLSTVLISEKQTLASYSVTGKGWSVERATETITKYKPDVKVDRMARNLVEVEELRVANWEKLNPAEKNLVQEPFSVVYGIKPNRPGSVSLVGSDISYEMAVKDGVKADEIVSIGVPKAQVERVKALIKNTPNGKNIEVYALEDVIH